MMRTNNFFARTFLITSILAGAAFAETKPSAETTDFISKAAIGNRFEVESSEIALTKSNDPDVKNFAQHMVDDHSKTKEELVDVLKRASIDSSIVPNSLDPKHQELLNKLKSLKGDVFDENYVDAQVTAHQEAIALFKSYSTKGDVADLKEFATKTLPTLDKHQQAATELQSNY